MRTPMLPHSRLCQKHTAFQPLVAGSNQAQGKIYTYCAQEGASVL